jgi:hypothetical protein
MNTLNKLLLACIPFIGLAACSGGDTQDRLDLAGSGRALRACRPTRARHHAYRGEAPSPT